MGGIMGLFAIVLNALQGGKAFEHFGLTTETGVGLYFFAGLTGGFVFGCLRPMLQHRWTAWCLSVIATYPTILVIFIMDSGSLSVFTLGDWIASVVISMIMGSVVYRGVWAVVSDKE